MTKSDLIQMIREYASLNENLRADESVIWVNVMFDVVSDETFLASGFTENDVHYHLERFMVA